MKSRVFLALMLICMLLSDSVHGVRWQGTGSGMNSTVLAQIWSNLESNINTALTTNNQDGYNAFTTQISDRLNYQWNQAWNVVLVKTQAKYDTVLYGYAFRNQWMWFNGIPNSVLGSSNIVTLIVWKDYNCINWGNIGEGSTGFTSNQRDHIRQFAYDMGQNTYQNNIWGGAFNMIKSLQNNAIFPQGGYSIILSQDNNFEIFGRICKIQDQFYHRTLLFSLFVDNPDGSTTAYQYGSLYLFRTR